jgi:Ca2+/Na+ antiporter
MADGGLLKKAMEQKTEDVIDAEIKFESDIQDSGGFSTLLGSNGMKLGLFLALIGLVSGFITANPQLQQDYSYAIFLPILLLSGSFFLLWSSLDRKMTGAIAVFCLLLLATPYAVTSLNSSSLTIVDDELSDDATQIVLKIRESGSLFGSSGSSADISINYDGAKVWSGEVSFSVDREDGFGPYGLLSLNVADFYSGNADANNKYVIKFVSGDSDLSYTLTDSSLQRTITDVQGDAIGSIGTNADCDNGKDVCVLGIGLRTWSGIDSTGSNRPVGIIHSDYTVQATLYYENIDSSSVSIDYPEVSIINGDATWDSMNGIYGSGSQSNIGDFGSELPLDGSVEDVTIGMYYIPTDEMNINDYGCYVYEVITSQDSTWSTAESQTSLTYYEYTESDEEQGSNQSKEEFWEQVNTC